MQDSTANAPTSFLFFTFLPICLATYGTKYANASDAIPLHPARYAGAVLLIPLCWKAMPLFLPAES
jgi:hypothetical protein